MKCPTHSFPKKTVVSYLYSYSRLKNFLRKFILRTFLTFFGFFLYFWDVSVWNISGFVYHWLLYEELPSILGYVICIRHRVFCKNHSNPNFCLPTQSYEVHNLQILANPVLSRMKANFIWELMVEIVIHSFQPKNTSSSMILRTCSKCRVVFILSLSDRAASSLCHCLWISTFLFLSISSILAWKNFSTLPNRTGNVCNGMSWTSEGKNSLSSRSILYFSRWR